jgi:prepilin-type N-terminal cleavage/methylation domain-containing protein
MKRAFTLLEALVTIGIIAILAGILLPVLVASKRSAIKTDDLSKLRQMGLAAAMYEDRFGEFPLSASQLVSNGMVPPELCASMRDASRAGIANDLAVFTNRKFADYEKIPIAPYKSSFAGLAEFGMGQPIMRNYVLTGPAPGWLIDATDSNKELWPTPSQWSGTYRRLCIDGSVVVRQYKDYQCYNNGKTEPCRMPVLLFVDPSPYFAELQKSNDRSYSGSRD